MMSPYGWVITVLIVLMGVTLAMIIDLVHQFRKDRRKG